jgi:Ca2+:H+ antiporter
MRVLLLIGYLAIPLAYVSHFWLARHGPEAARSMEPILTFILSGIGLIPLAHLMGRATEELSAKAGPTWGGLLNATFGNAAELIIGIIGLTKGLTVIVKSSLVGSVLGNLLLVAGGAMVVGGWNRERQSFSRASAQTSSALLAVGLAAMFFPAIFHYSFKFTDAHLLEHEMGVSIGTSIILLVVYALGLIFTLRTHSHIFSSRPSETPEDPGGISSLAGGGWSVRKSVLMLLIASVVVGLLSELLVGSVEQAAARLGWNEIFVSVVLVAIFGNAAEHSTAILLAHRNDMDTAMSITYQSSLQIALFATPFLVLLSGAMAWFSPHFTRLDLIFTPMEVAAVLMTVAVVVVIGLNGETNWFEGVLLLAVYAILGITFFYMPMHGSGGYDVGAAGPPAARGSGEPSGPQGSMNATAR